MPPTDTRVGRLVPDELVEAPSAVEHAGDEEVAVGGKLVSRVALEGALLAEQEGLLAVVAVAVGLDGQAGTQLLWEETNSRGRGLYSARVMAASRYGCFPLWLLPVMAASRFN